MFGAESARTLEERLGNYGKELRWIFRAVGVQHGGHSSFISGTQSLELLAHHSRPRQVLCPRRESGRAIGLEILEVKLVGGGRVLDSLSDVGARNIRFVKEYVQAEGFRVVGADLGSLYPRKVLYDPATGSAQVKRLARSDGRVVADETRYMRDIDATPVGGDIELF